MTVLVAADLDRTLIYSAAAAGDIDCLVCVETYQGRSASFMTAASLEDVRSIAASGRLVAVTTRTTDQLARVVLPGPPARFAVAANGGVLLVHGHPDADWTATVAGRIAGSASLAEVWTYLGRACRPEWTRSRRMAQDLFCYAVLDRARVPADFFAEAAQWAGERGWRTSLQGRKLYWVPTALTKSAAVSEAARRMNAEYVIAAGDSLLDVDLLERADRGIHPAHGELFDSGWRSPNVCCTTTSGARAGADIARWLRSTAAAVTSRTETARRNAG